MNLSSEANPLNPLPQEGLPNHSNILEKKLSVSPWITALCAQKFLTYSKPCRWPSTSESANSRKPKLIKPLQQM